MSKSVFAPAKGMRVSVTRGPEKGHSFKVYHINFLGVWDSGGRCYDPADLKKAGPND